MTSGSASNIRSVVIWSRYPSVKLAGHDHLSAVPSIFREETTDRNWKKSEETGLIDHEVSSKPRRLTRIVVACRIMRSPAMGRRHGRPETKWQELFRCGGKSHRHWLGFPARI